MKKILLINAHQTYAGFSEGGLNKTIINVITENLLARGCEVIHSHIEQSYDVEKEVEKHLWADLIITQSPVFWCALPWIYKKYIEEVFNEGLYQKTFVLDDGRTREDPSKQYGTGGQMQGRKYMLSLTWNAPQEAFSDKNQLLFAGKSVDDLFASNMAVYKFCGIELLPSFSCFNVVKAPTIETDMIRLKQRLDSLFDDTSEALEMQSDT